METKVRRAGPAPGAAHETPAQDAPVTAKTPSQAIIDDAAQDELVTDLKGRKLLLGVPPLLAEFRMIEAMGPEISQNQAWTQMALQLVFLKEIDGEPIRTPTSKLQIEGLLQRLGREGYGAIAEWNERRLKRAVDGINRESVKNS